MATALAGCFVVDGSPPMAADEDDDAREGRSLTADVPLLCQADLQMLVATHVGEYARR